MEACATFHMVVIEMDNSTSPPPQKPWVGGEKEDIDELFGFLEESDFHIWKRVGVFHIIMGYKGYSYDSEFTSIFRLNYSWQLVWFNTSKSSGCESSNKSFGNLLTILFFLPFFLPFVLFFFKCIYIYILFKGKVKVSI